MTWITHLLPSDIIHALSRTLMHALWQGAVLSILMGVLMVLMRRLTASVRYSVGVGALILMLLISGITFWDAYRQEQMVISIDQAPVVKTETNTSDPVSPLQIEGDQKNSSMVQHFTSYFSAHAPAFVSLWFLGVLIYILKFLGGFAYAQRLRHYKTFEADPQWEAILMEMACKLKIRKTVSIIQSQIAKTPLVIGHLKPIILVPAGFFTGLSEEELEAILIHELAHIKRLDYLVNLLLSLVEWVYFFHPGIRWISRMVRQEREYCCDDIALANISQGIDLARALTAVQEVAARPAMAFAGQKGQFFRRIKRLFTPDKPPGFSEGFSAAGLLTSAIIILIVGMNMARAHDASILPVIHNQIQNLVASSTVNGQKANVKIMQTSLSMEEAGDIQIFGEVESDNGKRPDLTSWIIDQQNGEVVWHLLPRQLKRQKRTYRFDEIIPLEAGEYAWYVPQLGISYIKKLDGKNAVAVSSRQAAQDSTASPESAPATESTTTAVASGAAAAVAAVEATAAVAATAADAATAVSSTSGTSSIAVATTGYSRQVTRSVTWHHSPRSTRTIDSHIRTKGKKRRIQATIVNGHVIKFKLNNIHFLEKDILSNWDFVTTVLSQIEGHQYVYLKPGDLKQNTAASTASETPRSQQYADRRSSGSRLKNPSDGQELAHRRPSAPIDTQTLDRRVSQVMKRNRPDHLAINLGSLPNDVCDQIHDDILEMMHRELDGTSNRTKVATTLTLGEPPKQMTLQLQGLSTDRIHPLRVQILQRILQDESRPLEK